MKKLIALGLIGAVGTGALFSAPMRAQAQFYGAEDGYDDDEFGWGPAYRPETNFRPAIGFYGGVERPYPYGAPETTNPVVRNGVVYYGVPSGIVARPFFRGGPLHYAPRRAARTRLAYRSRRSVTRHAAPRHAVASRGRRGDNLGQRMY